MGTGIDFESKLNYCALKRKEKHNYKRYKYSKR